VIQKLEPKCAMGQWKLSCSHVTLRDNFWFEGMRVSIGLNTTQFGSVLPEKRILNTMNIDFEVDTERAKSWWKY